MIAKTENAVNNVELGQNAAANDNEPSAFVGTRKFEWPRATVITKEVTNKDTGKTQTIETGRKVHKNSLVNIAYHLNFHQSKPSYNTLAQRTEINGEPITDAMIRTLWFDAKKRGLPDTFDEYYQAVLSNATQFQYHPVLRYLTGLTWDGKPRVDTWLSTYLGAEDTPINQTFGRVTLLGACWRVIEPGIKFDTMLLLADADQGTGKSLSIDILGGEWFTDNFQLGLKTRELVEQTLGHWFVEVPEMSGMSAWRVEQIKAQVSRRVDKTRIVWERVPRDFKRQFIFVGTTNNLKVLKDPTGNRRFMPVMTGKIDLKALRRDRDQLLAEAYHRARSGETAVIPENQWKLAGAVQEAHRQVSSFEEAIRELVDGVEGILLKSDLWDRLEVLSPHYKRTDQKQANDMTAIMSGLKWKADERRWPGLGRSARARYVYCKGPEVWLTWSGAFIPVVSPVCTGSAEDTQDTENP